MSAWSVVPRIVAKFGVKSGDKLTCVCGQNKPLDAPNFMQHFRSKRCSAGEEYRNKKKEKKEKKDGKKKKNKKKDN